MKVRFNMKGVIYGAILLALIVGGFIFIPNMFIENSKPIDYTIMQRDAIPEKILDMMDKYTNEERALAAKLDGKIYVIVTKNKDKNTGIEIQKIESLKEEDKSVMRVTIKYKDKDKSSPYIVTETNLTELPDKIELNSIKEDK